MTIAAALLTACLTGFALEAEAPPGGLSQAAAAPLLESNASGPRRRAVSHPAMPSHVMIDVKADDDLRYTNHDSKTITIKACLERTDKCLSDTLAPGASATKPDVVKGLGRDASTLEIYTTGIAEIRGHFDAFPTLLLTSQRQTMPVMAPGQTFSVYSWAGGSADLHYLLSNGAERDRQTIQFSPGTTALSPRPMAVGEQLDIVPASPALLMSTVAGVQYRAKHRFEATGRQFIVSADSRTTAWAKNPDPTAILSLTSIRYVRETTNTFVNYASAVNWGTTPLDNMTNGVPGAVDIHGMRLNNIEEPFNLWSNALVQLDGATSNTRFVFAPRHNVSLNQIPSSGVVSLFAAETDAAYTLNAYDDAGRKTGTLTGSLQPNQNTDVDMRPLAGTRIEVVAADRTDNVAGNPNLLIGATIDGVAKGGFRIAKPEPAQPQYEMTTTIGVWADGRLLQGSGTTRDYRLMQLIAGISNPENRAGGFWTNTNDSNWRTLNDMVNAIKKNFTAADYVSVFKEPLSTLAPYFADTDGDTYAIDAGGSDWPHDDATTAPGNQPTGVMFINYKIDKLAAEPKYEISAEIYVKDSGQVLMQRSTPTADVMKKLLNLENLLFYDDKLISYACDSFPDPVVNTLPELIGNYQTKLSLAEKQNFSGDEEGFRPYAASPCSNAPQNVYLVRVKFDRVN